MSRRVRSNPGGIRAAIDCGSNSVHLLVAAVKGHRIQALVDDSTFVGLGAAAATGELGPAATGRLVATVVAYAGVARRLGAAKVVVVGTEPFRRAADAQGVVRQLSAASKAPVDVVSHDEEAFLTLIGVTGGRPVGDALLVCDVGGGSTELGILEPGRRPRAVGIRVGSAGLTDEVVRHDPPTAAEVRTLMQRAAELIADAPPGHAGRIVAVGGSATNLARLASPAIVDGALRRSDLAEALLTLRSQPAAATALRYRMTATRARILPAGAAILDAVLAHYQANETQVSGLGIREGIILATSRAGKAWRRRLRSLAVGWGAPEDD